MSLTSDFCEAAGGPAGSITVAFLFTNPALRGARMYSQWITTDVTASAAGLVLSNALASTIF